MYERLVALELVLKALDIDSSIQDLSDRIRFQKAIYLSQEAGVRLGYGFGWYVRGPYSPSLARDYYYLHMARDKSTVTHDRKLRKAILSQLNNIRPLMSPPSAVTLDTSNWLELVSSLHYLRNAAGKEASEKLANVKPHLSKYIPYAEEKLVEAGLLSDTGLTADSKG